MGEKRPILERNGEITLKQFIDVIKNRALCKVWTIILLRQVGQDNAPSALVDHLAQQFPGLLI